MSRITQAFEKRKSRGVLVAYITGGDPTLEVTEALVPVLASAGADVVELGMPFSDPLLTDPLSNIPLSEPWKTAPPPAVFWALSGVCGTTDMKFPSRS